MPRAYYIGALVYQYSLPPKHFFCNWRYLIVTYGNLHASAADKDATPGDSSGDMKAAFHPSAVAVTAPTP